MHSAKKSHNGTDKSVPYGRALPLIQGLTKLFCEFAKRTRALPDKQFVCRSADNRARLYTHRQEGRATVRLTFGIAKRADQCMRARLEVQAG